MINVCYCCNRRIFHGVVLSAISVAMRASDALTIYLLTMDLTDVGESFSPITGEQADVLEKILKNYNEASEVKLTDCTDLYRKNMLGGKNESSGYTPYMFLRLFLDRIEGMPSKMLYLDADVMALADIAELYDIDVNDVELAAVLDKVGHFWITEQYFNSGVLLLNLDKIRESGLFKKCVDFCRERKLIMCDQSALNKFVTDKKILPYKYNEQRDIQEDTVIKHFCKGFIWYDFKQWERETVKKKFGDDIFKEEYEAFDRFDEMYFIMQSCETS